MKYVITLYAILISSFCQSLICEPVSFKFGGNEWSFPSSVEDAVKKYKLGYKPPGYYYKVDSLGMEVILDFHFESGDFYNEYQPREVLFSRKLHSYIFRFKERPGVYDSLQQSIEQTYNRKFILTKGLKTGWDFEEHEKYFAYNFLTASPCLTIGIKRSLPEKKEKIITVRFMYDLPLGQMGVVMGSY